MGLIWADVTRSVWMFIFGLVNLSGTAVSTRSSFCQATGYFIQVGIEQAGEDSSPLLPGSDLTGYRFCSTTYRHTYRFTDLQALDQSVRRSRVRDWPLSLQNWGVHRLRNLAVVHVLAGLRQRKRRLHCLRSFLRVTYSAFLVSVGYILDTSLRDHDNNSRTLPRDLHPCSATVSIDKLATTLSGRLWARRNISNLSEHVLRRD